MNHLLDSDRERELAKNLDKATRDALDPFFGVRRLVPAAMDAGRKALADDAKPFTCFKCGTGCEDWDGSVCETCGEWFCDDHLVTDAQAMAPEACHACDRENREILDTYGTMPKGRD